MRGYHYTTWERQFTVSEFESQADSGLQVLLEVHRDGVWIPVRIARDFPTIRAAINALPIFAKQQKVEHDDVRVKHLRTWEAVCAAQQAINRVNQPLLDDDFDARR
jgi:hypothetical protein